MAADVRGADEIIRALKQKFSSEKWSRIENKALKSGAEVVAKEVKKGLEAYKDTGATVDELVVSKPKKKGGYKHVLIGWNGPKQRYRIIHLNEFGYNLNGKHISPRGKGKIRKATGVSKKAYLKAVKKELSKHL